MAKSKAKTIVIGNQKGGVGKTTTTIALGAALAIKGKKVLLIDCDDTGNTTLSKHLGAGIDITLTDLMHDRISYQSGLSKRLNYPDPGVAVQRHNEGFDFIAADSSLPGITANAFGLLTGEAELKRPFIVREILDNLKTDYDYILLDAAPALNMMTTNLLTAADWVVITTEAEGASDDAIGTFIHTTAQIKQNLNPSLIVRGLLVTKIDTRTNYHKAKSESIDQQYSELGLRIFGTQIPRAIKCAECNDKGISIIAYDPKGKAAQAYTAFADELTE